MTDGITAVLRDRDIYEKINYIRELQRKFRRSNSIEIAKEIVDNLEVLCSWKGYKLSTNLEEIREDIFKYNNYISNNSNF